MLDITGTSYLADDKNDERVQQHFQVRRAMAMPCCDENDVVCFRVKGHSPSARLRGNILHHPKFLRGILVNDGERSRPAG